jgi:hypothetical protein
MAGDYFAIRKKEEPAAGLRRTMLDKLPWVIEHASFA